MAANKGPLVVVLGLFGQASAGSGSSTAVHYSTKLGKLGNRPAAPVMSGREVEEREKWI